MDVSFFLLGDDLPGVVDSPVLRELFSPDPINPEYSAIDTAVVHERNLEKGLHDTKLPQPNESQRSYVLNCLTHNRCVSSCIGPPGTGKTTMLTYLYLALGKKTLATSVRLSACNSMFKALLQAANSGVYYGSLERAHEEHCDLLVEQHCRIIVNKASQIPNPNTPTLRLSHV